ncbi:MAG TPA: hypothetical protein PLZ95_01730 [Bryobacteraceae bacterium]|nr:hypothetical protein [Bryobacteraceae bacterium]
MRATVLAGLGVAIFCLGLGVRGFGQRPPASKAEVSVSCRQLLESHFVANSIRTEEARFALHVSILPFVGRERQISLIYDLDRRARVRIITFDKPLCQALASFQNDNGRLPSDDEAGALAQPRTTDLPIDPALAKQWMTRFWNEVSEVARTAPAVALTGEANGEVTITLDPNVYEFRFIDEHKSLQLSLAGPVADRVRGPDGLEPLVRWAIDVAQQCESLQERRTK